MTANQKASVEQHVTLSADFYRNLQERPMCDLDFVAGVMRRTCNLQTSKRKDLQQVSFNHAEQITRYGMEIWFDIFDLDQ